MIDEGIADAWPFVEHLVEKACGHTQGRMTPKDVLEQSLAGQHQLWIYVDKGAPAAVWFTSLLAHAPGLVAEIWLAASDPGALTAEEARLMVGLVEAWAQGQGAIAVEIHGRAGWGRVFSAAGYGESYRVFTKELGHG